MIIEYLFVVMVELGGITQATTMYPTSGPHGCMQRAIKYNGESRDELKYAVCMPIVKERFPDDEASR